jgi:hypothetical protein
MEASLMATGSAAGSGGSQVMTALTHALPAVLAVAVVLRVASWFGWLTWLDLGAAVALLVCTFAALFHCRGYHLCVRCMDEVPADAPVRAERQKAALWFCHVMTSSAGFCLIAAVIAVPVVVATLDEPTLERLTRIPLDLLLFAGAYAGWRHHQWRPWCPYCRGWDEDGDPEPSPDPTTFGTRTGL